MSKLLLGSVASAALWLGAAPPAIADCGAPVGGVITCTGNELAGGVTYSVGNATLNAFSLSTDAGKVELNGSGGNGSNGGFASSGSGGGNGTTTVLNYNGAPQTGAGLIARANGGNGGSGGDGITVVAPINAGHGAGGGAGGSVTVDSTGNLTTIGDKIHGILAEANGGNGGNGGNISGVGILGTAGNGGQGGIGGSVAVTTHSGTITTSGTGAAGILAQSNGGIAGSGGSASGPIIVGEGGNGADPKAGGTVDVINAGSIVTHGKGGIGIFVQSIGGYAGSGGSGGGLIAFGGSAASAGDGGNVSVGNSGSIHTEQADAHGIFAQSVGGGGGAGGSSGGVISLGGSGGLGGSGKKVVVNNFSGGAITTDSDRSVGILAQSVGGGGGDGGDSGGLISIGGNSTGGGTGGIVEVSNAGSIVTHGVSSQAILAQSIGGGGGNGGTSGGLVPIGGKGGGGGNADAVTVSNSGSLETTGHDSTALLAQSVGGGGGNGGAASGGGPFVGFSLGGTGGKGGEGKKATVNLSQSGVPAAIITTQGARSNGVTVQSIGGGGGNGGAAITAAVGYSGSLSIAVGGKAGDGGKGGQAELTGSAIVNTSGENADGILVQSVGGGGGSGGYAISISVALGETAAIAGAVGIGGAGGKGGIGDTVTVNAGGSIHTRGDKSEGLIAQSVGGGGGTGGYSLTLAAAGAGVAAGAGTVGVGGSGGDGGQGGAVNATYAGNVTTEGDESDGVIIQSVGGGGGNGGFTIGGAISGAGTGAGAVAIGIGGSGGTGGNADIVTGKVIGNIETGKVISANNIKGAGSTAFLVQSVGGGGGNGGFNVTGTITGSNTGAGGVAVGVGGTGAGGGHAEAVTGTLIGNATTHGKDAAAVVVQSVGGGGGNGGFAITGGITVSGQGGGTVTVGVGGSAGAGGNAKKVIADVTGDIKTEGAGSTGFMAQSLGGGGGNGGFTVSGAVSVAGKGSGAVAVGVGGSGGKGGHAGEVDAGVVGDIETAGDKAVGYIAQSLGGGGGNGGFSVAGGISIAGEGSGAVAVGIGGSGGEGGNADIVTADLNGDITTKGNQSDGFVAQSLGGGGGNGGFNVSGGLSAASKGSGVVSVGIGGMGGDGGTSQKVTATVTGDVSTERDQSRGIVVQSIAGGGGNGAFNVSGGVSFSRELAGNVGVGVGGFGGGGGSVLGKVTSTVNGDIDTKGADATGLLVQSLGGGGGNGGFNVTGGLSGSAKNGGTLGVGIGGFGGGAGNGGEVLSNSTGDITTQGNGAKGAVVQSLGGAGGNGGINVTGSVALTGGKSGVIGVGIGGFGGGGGTATNVNGSHTGDVTTQGNDADGILVQSVGGGGGNGGLNVTAGLSASVGDSGAFGFGLGGFGGTGGRSGNVDFDVIGDVTTHGDLADGVTIQSIGGGGGNGAMNVTGDLALTFAGTSAAVGLGIGGFGGGAGDAGNVTAVVTGAVIADGSNGTGLGEPVVIDGINRWANGSNGVLAQSIGGGGGNGGLNISGALSGGVMIGKSYAVSLGLGGFGGGGGDADFVNLTAKSPTLFQATGDYRSAVTAQSIGGGGGNGAINVSGSVTLNGQLTAGVGGFAGDGGVAKRVDATVEGKLVASGVQARGLLAQSIGGGGGDGGINISGGLNLSSDPNKPSLVFGLGGFGGDGNTSGIVDVKQKGEIEVEGTDSIGILVQSVAGGGGSGGLNVSGSLALGQGYSAALGIGGNGGTGDDAADVILKSDGKIVVSSNVALPADHDDYERTKEKYGERGGGIVAQSIGGGGGVGGLNVSGVITPKGNPIVIGVGGSGGAGGNAGSVTVDRGLTTAALIQTTGDESNGLTAQSIGGGGGSAGMNIGISLNGAPPDSSPKQLSIAIGGQGGAAGIAGNVTVTNEGDVHTFGKRSDGIFAQSIGGGGGNANINIVGGINKSATGVNLAVGGGTGDGGKGGIVKVDHTGNITTEQEDSIAIFAQSVGGGGGNTRTSTAVAVKSKNAVNVGIGREGGTGADGGNVTVNSDGTLITKGDRSIGILAQSVGGGGGKSGTIAIGVKATQGSGDEAQSGSAGIQVGLKGGDSGIGGDVLVETSGSITTGGDEAHAIFAQSVGGGGGIGGGVLTPIIKENFSARVGVGGEGGTGSDAGLVTVHNEATLKTTGDKSAGISAQSTGGGGGTGGQIIQVTLASGGEGKDNNTGTVNIGGKGGEGANGKKAWVTNSGVITTEGKDAYGIQARSVGGGGGDGGLVFTGTLSYKGNSNSLELAMGGDGGKGGTGGMAEVLNEGTIWTKGEGATGIQAMSLGGGGGDGGLVANLSLTVPQGESSSKRILMNVGGRGGEAGTGGEVKVTNRPDDNDAGGVIITEGNKAHGIFAQSIGGGGGNGGSVVSLNFASGKNSALIGLNIGGKGGTGNTGGTVNVINEGKITTKGDEAYGVLAQSIGGGGGNGGIALAVNAVISSESTAPVLALGGLGGSGGNGGLVHVNNSGAITTTGKNAHGIVAQSVGGGGGNANVGIGIGGLSTLIANPLSFALGAGCTALGCYSGGQGGKVIVDNTGTISVSGEGAQAIKAESLNGGGGSFVMDFIGITSLAGGNALPSVDDNNTADRITQDPVVTLLAGAKGAANSTAGAVTINTTGANYVQGNYGTGTGVQAVGGGGGNIFAKFALNDEGEIDPLKIAGQLGGTGGSNNKGGDITDSGLSGEIGMFGDLSSGLFIQTIGGGGGRSNIQVTTTQGMIGGGIVLGLGGSNGYDEGGGDVTLTQSGYIYAKGKGSIGSFVQSVGGGGGYGTFTMKDASASIAASAASSVMASAALVPSTATVTFGSDGGSLLDGGDISLTKTGNSVTTDDLGVAILKQSVGAGGGTQIVLGIDEIDVNLGGTAGASGIGGSVTLSNTGIVQTAGAGAHGIFLQSIGGGGGFLVNDASTVATTLRNDNTGNGGAVTLTQIGDVVTKGVDTFGVAAQSIGGGGGFIYGSFIDSSFAGTAGGTGNGGAITLDLEGSVVTEGARSTAVFAQSVGDAGGNIEVSLLAGKYIVGGALGTGVKFDGGATNKFTNNGYVFTADEIQGLAVTGTSGNEAILNNFYMAGIVDLGLGANSYTNAQVARFDMGNLVNLNDGANELLNNGIIAPGGTNAIATVHTTLVKGALEQSMTGFYEVDLDFVAGNAVTGNADRINATGAAALKGTVDLKIVNPTQVSPGYHEVTILSADGTVTDQSLILKAPASAVAIYDILYPNPNDVVLSYDIDFSGAGTGGMNRNQTRFGDYINRLQIADSKTRLAPLVGYLFLIPTIEDLRATYAMLTPEVYASNLSTTLTAVDDFSQALMSCRQVAGEYRFVAQGECAWMRGSGRRTTYDSSFQYNGYEEDVYQVAGGFQGRVGENEFIGLGFSYEDTDGELTDLARVDGDRIQLGLVAKTRSGGTTAAGSVVVGRGWFDTKRVVALGDLGGLAEGKQEMTFTSGRLQLAHAFDYDDSYLRVGVDASLTAIFQDDFREHGGGLGNLAIDDHDNVNAFVMPFVELGGETTLGDDAFLRAWSKLAFVQYIDPDNKVYAGLIGAAEGVDSFYADAGFDSSLGRLELGLDILSQGGAVLGLSGVGVLGEDTEIYQGSVKASIPF